MPRPSDLPAVQQQGPSLANGLERGPDVVDEVGWQLGPVCPGASAAHPRRGCCLIGVGAALGRLWILFSGRICWWRRGIDRCGHPLPPEPHDVVEHQRVVRVVEAVVVPRGGERDRRGIAMGEHRVHPGDRLGRGGVDRTDPGVRVGAAQHRNMQQPSRRDVKRVPLRPTNDTPASRCPHRPAAPAPAPPPRSGCRLRRTTLELPQSASRTRILPLRASTIGRYPVQQHRLPLSSSARSGSAGSPSTDAVTTMPGVQKPHWKPAVVMKCRCTGCRSSGLPRPAAVVIERPCARNAGYTHECTGSPSSSTEHAPQSPASQPILTSVWPSWRSRVRRHWPGAGSASAVVPLMSSLTTARP